MWSLRWMCSLANWQTSHLICYWIAQFGAFEAGSRGLLSEPSAYEWSWATESFSYMKDRENKSCLYMAHLGVTLWRNSFLTIGQ